MSELFIEKSIAINAPADTVWKVLTDQEMNRQWIEQFWPGFIILEGDWRVEGEMIWKAADGKIEGLILEIDPGRQLRYTFTMPQDIVTLTLDEDAEHTLLSVRHGNFADQPHGEECYEGALAGWEMNLSNIKALSELGRLAESSSV